MEERKGKISVNTTKKQVENIFSDPTILKRYQELLPKREQALKSRIEEINAFLIEKEEAAIQEDTVKEEFSLAFKSFILKKAFEKMLKDNEFDMRKSILDVLDEKSLEEAIQGTILPVIIRRLAGLGRSNTFYDSIHFGSFLLRFDEKFLGDETLKTIMRETEE